MRFVSCAGQRDVQVTLEGCPRASQATLSSSLRSCVTSSFSPCPPPDPSISLISDTPHLTPSSQVSERLLQKLDKSTDLSGEAGRQPGVICVCGLSRGSLSRNSICEGTSYPRLETSRGWAAQIIGASCLVDTGER